MHRAVHCIEAYSYALLDMAPCINMCACRCAVLLMQNEVTSRIEAENVLTEMSEGQVRRETEEEG